MNFKKGDRIRILHMQEDPSWNKTIKQGDKATVTSIDKIAFLNQTQVWIETDKGQRIALLEGIDRFELIREEEDK